MSVILFFLFTFIALLLLPRIFRFSLAFSLSIFQLYTVPVSGFYPSLALVSQFSLTPTLLGIWRALIKSPVIFLIALIGMQMLSLSWSSDVKLGLATILYEVPFIIMFAAAYELSNNRPEKMFSLIKAYAFFSLIPLLMIFFFRLHHQLNIEYLRSEAAKLFINPNTIIWYFQLNGLDITPTASLSSSFFQQLMQIDLGSFTKPRGIFINPNVAAGYAGICALFFYGAGIRYQSNMMKYIAALHWLSIAPTLSVAGILLGLLFPLGIGLVQLIQHKSYALLKILATLSASSIACFFLISPNLMDILIYKINSRFVFWQASKVILAHHLTFGLGFGGWEKPYEAYRTSLAIPNVLLAPNLPPHNTFIQLTYQSGIFAAVFGLLFMVSTLWICYHVFKSAMNAKEKLSILCFSSAIAWVFLQGMGENWGLVGELHILPIFAVLLAIIMSSYKKSTTS